MRWLFALVVAAGCASAGNEPPGDDEPMNMVDAMVADEMCLDTDLDGVCNHIDKCPGADDAIDTDMDTVADGCDDCPGMDDRLDANGNMIPDCTELQTATVNVKKVGTNTWRGWYNSEGAHTTTNDNTITGISGAANANYNSYFIFTLNLTATTVASVTLELEKEGYTSADATETVSMWDVTTAPATLEANAANTTIALQRYNDLASGTTYGTGMITAAMPIGTILSFPLNAAAATSVQAALGQDWAIGLHLDTPIGWVRFSMLEEARVARLVIRYLP